MENKSTMVEQPFEIIAQTSEKATACVIFLHGARHPGSWQKNKILEKLGDAARFPHIKFIFPTAPKAYCIFFDEVIHSWFNFKRSEIHQSLVYAELNESDIEKSCFTVEQMINDVVKSGIPRSRIILGGVSQGGFLAQYVAYSQKQNHSLKAVFCMSSVYGVDGWDKTREFLSEETPLYHLHFTNDEMADLYGAKIGVEFLRSKNVKCELVILDGNFHEPNTEMLELAYSWISKQLPNNI